MCSYEVVEIICKFNNIFVSGDKRFSSLEKLLLRKITIVREMAAQIIGLHRTLCWECWSTCIYPPLHAARYMGTTRRCVTKYWTSF